MANKKISLAGQLLLAPPQVLDDVFDHSVILVCSHDETGAIGLIVNHPLDSITFLELLTHLQLAGGKKLAHKKVYLGGPVDMNRGFVLHSTDVLHDSSTIISRNIALTANSEFLNTLQKTVPKHLLVTLGYSGWANGQLEEEIKEGRWIQMPARSKILFDTPDTKKWGASFDTIGIDPLYLSHEIGTA